MTGLFLLNLLNNEYFAVKSMKNTKRLRRSKIVSRTDQIASNPSQTLPKRTTR